MAKDQPTSEIIELKKKLEENPDSLAFAPLADAYRKQGNLAEALQVCRKGLERHPNNTSGRVVLGRVYREQGQADAAVSEFKKVLDLDPENLMAHSFLGSVYMEKGDHQAAIEEYQKILTLNPDDEETQSALKQAIESAAGEAKGVRPAKKDPPPAVKKAPPKESTASLTIAELYLKQGHFDKAIEVYQELLANDPQNLMLRQKLSEIVERQQKEAAVEPAGAKLKKNEFIRPPDQKEDILEDQGDPKRGGKAKKEDDSKFTSEDILQVMRRGGKDDVVVEDKKGIPVARPAAPDIKTTVSGKRGGDSLPAEKIDVLKGILADLSSVEGILGCFITSNEGTIVVSMGQTGPQAEGGGQAAAIFESTHRSVDRLNQGQLQQVLVTAETGHILLVSFAAYVLVVLADSRINLGLLRLALDSAIKKLERIL